jgi:hypothetical protein
MKLLFLRKFKKFGILAALCLGLGLGLASFPSPLLAQMPLSAAACVPHNSQVQGEVIFLGKIPDAPYVVIIPLRGDTEILTIVQQCVEDAFQTRSRFGQYIQAGAFARRSAARTLTRHLRSLGLDARTVYAP